MLSVPSAFGAAVIIGAAVFFCRVLPFIIFKRSKNAGSKSAAFLNFVEKTAPPVTMAVLAFRELTMPLNTNIKEFGFSKEAMLASLPVLCAAALCVILHIIKRNALISIFCATALYMVLISSCTQAQSDLSYYMSETNGSKNELKIIFNSLKDAKTDDECFAAIREIANIYSKTENYYKSITFLTEWVINHPDDVYNSYYLLRVADSYMHIDSLPIAALYFDIIVRSYPDLIVRGESVHLASLKQLINLAPENKHKIWCYEQIIARFPDKIDGSVFFMQGQVYEDLGRWEEAITAYKNFMPYYGTIITGFPDAYAYAKQMVDLSIILKNYGSEEAKLARTFASLNGAINAVRRALDEADSWGLWAYRSRVNFFARSWTSIGGDDESGSDLNLSLLNTPGQINYASELSAGSGSNDAYLRTWGWSKYSPVWYFYFRKIYFPMDPQINGRWEWAGVYYGERF